MNLVKTAAVKNRPPPGMAGGWWVIGLSRIGVVALLLLGRWLTPSKSGQGTHQQLGLPPCPFLALTGIPCPSCGMTTSFSHAAHLQLVESFVVHPFGLLFFIMCLAWIPGSYLLEYRRDYHPGPLLDRVTARRFLYLLLSAGLFSWLYRIWRMSFFE